MSERVLVGAGVGSGVANGPAFVLTRPTQSLALISTPGNRIGLIAIKKAIDKVASDLENIKTAGAALEVTQALAMILRDPTLLEVVKSFLAEGLEASDALKRAFDKFARQLEQLGGYFAARAADLGYLCSRVIDELAGVQNGADFPAEPFILVADSISPIDAAALDPKRVLGVITGKGTPTSHASIIIRAANLPMVVGVVDAATIQTGQQLLLDATSGQVYVNPSNDVLGHYRNATHPDTALIAAIRDSGPLEASLFANLGSSIESAQALESGAEGVGLFRTELLYLGRKTPPEFEEQVEEYSALLANFGSRRVLVRVLDLDFDKPLPFLKPAGSGQYANRGLQVLLANPEVLKTQLEALAQAAKLNPNSNLWVMAPMVLNALEVRAFASLAREAGLTKVGAMIEVPEVAEPAEIAAILAEVDFLSIGTNDLTHYTLGESRESGTITLADTRQPKVMQIIKSVVAAAKSAAKPVGICGEAASDPESAKLFISFGVDSLSASPALLPGLRAELSQGF
jgi:phosphotransferase system enzyme I (PtsI)